MEDGRLILLTSPGTLSRIASFKFALFCWQQYLKNYPSSSHFKTTKTTIKVSDIFGVSLPKHITELINRHIEFLLGKLDVWSDFHASKISTISRMGAIDCVVLKPSGSIICFESTARNMMESDRLTLLEKYSIACTYCFTEYIECLWPQVSNLRPHLKSSAMDYWNNVNRNGYIGLPEINLIDNRDWYLPTALEYWNKAGANISEILISIFRACPDVENEISLYTVLFLLYNSDTTCQNELIRKFPTKLLSILALHDEDPSIRTLQLWHHVKDYITDDQFRHLIEFLCSRGYGIIKNVGIHVDALLNEIWSAALNHQRTNVLDYFSRYPVLIFLQLYCKTNDMRNCNQNIEFFLRIMDCLSYEERNKLWYIYWIAFVELASVSGLNSLMSLCLKDADEIAKFNQNYVTNYSKLEGTWKRFVLAGKYQELTEYLMFFYPNENSLQETRQKILNSLLEDDLKIHVSSMYFYSIIHKCRFNLYSDQCIQFNDFIDNSFLSTNSAQKFKKDFILYYIGLRKDNLSNSFMLVEIRDMAEAFFSDDQQFLIEMKLKIYELCRSFSILKPGNESIRLRILREWRDFYEWCGFKEVPVFKKIADETYLAELPEKSGEIKKSQISRKSKGFKNFISKIKDIF